MPIVARSVSALGISITPKIKSFLSLNTAAMLAGAESDDGAEAVANAIVYGVAHALNSPIVAAAFAAGVVAPAAAVPAVGALMHNVLKPSCLEPPPVPVPAPPSAGGKMTVIPSPPSMLASVSTLGLSIVGPIKSFILANMNAMGVGSSSSSDGDTAIANAIAFGIAKALGGSVMASVFAAGIATPVGGPFGSLIATAWAPVMIEPPPL